MSSLSGCNAQCKSGSEKDMSQYTGGEGMPSTSPPIAWLDQESGTQILKGIQSSLSFAVKILEMLKHNFLHLKAHLVGRVEGWLKLGQL